MEIKEITVNKEKELDLLFLLRTVLKHWRQMIIAAVICVVLFDAFHAVKYYNDWKRGTEAAAALEAQQEEARLLAEENQRKAREAEEEAAAKREEIRQESIEKAGREAKKEANKEAEKIVDSAEREAKEAFADYTSAKQKKEEILDYQSHLLLMRFDTANVSESRSVYYFNGNKGLTGIIEVLKSELLDEETLNKISKISGLSEDYASDIGNYIEIRTNNDEESTSFGIYLPERIFLVKIDEADQYEALKNYTGECVMTVTVDAPDQKSCEGITSVLTERIESDLDILRGIFGDFTSEKISEVYSTVNRTDYYEQQRAEIEKALKVDREIQEIERRVASDPAMEEFFKAMLDGSAADRKAILTRVEGEIYAEKLYEIEAAYPSEEAALESPLAEEVREPVEYPVFSRRELAFNSETLLLGVLAGVLLVCGFFAFRYLRDPHINSIAELTRYCGLTIVSVIGAGLYGNGSVPKKGLDYLIDRIGREKGDGLTLEEKRQILAADLIAQHRKAGLSSLHLILPESDIPQEGGKEVLSGTLAAEDFSKALIKELTDAQVTVTKGGSSSRSAESLKMLTEAEGLLFIEILQGSRHEDLIGDLLAGKRYSKKILGAVVFEV